MERQALPLIPVPFRLVVRQVRTEEGYVTDPLATRQLGVLRGLLENAEGVVIATDAGREGELVSRYLLDYLGYRKPALRLWISSLTEKAILNGFKNLREDGDFDNLALAARARREADWILGVNASIALGIVAGISNHSLGRVQTPTLALVCRRYLENRDFVPVSCYHLRTGVCKDGQKVLFTCPLRYERKEDAEKARAGLEGESRCTVLAVKKKENMEEPPLPHDLTGLQQEANTRLGMAAGQTLAVVQRLYERGYVSYPRTGCRHIPEDIFEQAPTLIASLKGHPRFGRHAERLLEKGLNSCGGREQRNGTPCPSHHGRGARRTLPGRAEHLLLDRREDAGSIFRRMCQGDRTCQGRLRRNGIRGRNLMCEVSGMAGHL